MRVVEPNDPMYLRHGTIEKDGKRHAYWRLVRSVRAGRKVRQQTVATLGELNERGRLEARALWKSLRPKFNFTDTDEAGGTERDRSRAACRKCGWNRDDSLEMGGWGGSCGGP